MKKTNVALGVVIALGVVWTGASWFTGKQLESNIDQVITGANQQIAEFMPGSHLLLSKQNFSRGIFSSSLQLVLEGSPEATENDFLPAGRKIIFNETVDHGPFPLAQVRRLNLLPAAASVHSELVSNDTLKGLFTLSDGKSPLSAETRLGYNKASDTQISLLPLSYSDDTGKISTQASEMTIAADGEQNNIQVSAGIGDLAASFHNDSNLPVSITLSGLNFSGNTHLSPEGLRLGSQKLALNSLSSEVNSQPVLAIKGVNINSDFDNKAGKTSGKLNYTVDSLQLKQQPLGSASLAVTLSNFDTLSVKQFYDNYNQVVKQNLAEIAQGSQDDPQVMQQAVNTALLENLPLLLKGSPVLSVDSLSLKNDKGESHFSLKADFNDPASVTTAPQSLAQVADSYMKNLDASLTVNMPMAQQLLSVIGQSQGYRAEDAEKLAAQQIQGLSAMGQMFHLATVKQQDIVSALQYRQGEVTVNGDKMPLDQFIQQYVPALPDAQ